jgi:uncharacterized protein YjiS (DUF1127 family)
MSDTVFFTGTAPHASSFKASAARIATLVESTCATLSEWRHRYRSRRELAQYSRHQRNDLCFSAEVDAEIAKPFWSK